MGKWSHLRGKYETTPVQTEYQEKLDQLKETMIPIPTNELLKMLASIKDQKDNLEERIKSVNLQVAGLTSVILDRWDGDGTESVKLEGIGTISRTDEPYASAQDHGALLAWLRDNQLGDVIKETVHPSTLNSLVKERIEQALELPIETVLKVHIKQGLRVTKLKPKGE